MTSQSNDGSVGSSEVIIDDDDADLYITGLNGYRVKENLTTASTVSPFINDPYIFAGHFGGRHVERGLSARTEDARQWRCEVNDTNALLSRYLFRPDENAKRPAETQEERWEWLKATDQMALTYTDERYVDVSETVNLGPSDFSGQSPLAVLADMARQSRYMYGSRWSGDLEKNAVVYLPQDSTLLTTDIRLTNVLADVDRNLTFEVSQDTDLYIDPSRVASGLMARGDRVETYQTREETADEFGRRDLPLDEPFVRSLSVLRTRTKRALQDLATEMPKITGTVYLPATKAARLKDWHRVSVKFSHLPGFTDWTWCRVVSATHQQLTEDVYAVRFELTIPTVPPDGGSGGGNQYAILRGVGKVDDSGLMHWAHTGDAPGAGYDTRPTVGPFSFLTDSIVASRPYYAIQVDGDGTIDTINFLASAIGVSRGDFSYDVVWSIALNGVPIESQSVNVPLDPSMGGLHGWGSEGTLVTATNVAVSDGDVITAYITDSPPLVSNVPMGIGNFSERLEIVGGNVV